MGSYASQTTERELWLINHYVLDLKDALDGKPKRAFIDEASSEDVASVEETAGEEETTEAQTEE